MIRRLFRRWFGTRIGCTSCGERLDRDVPWLCPASPSKLQADHAPSCPDIIARKVRNGAS
jgi:hypothetical protein